MDKTGFLIFDYFDNFSYFETAGSQEVRGNGCSISNRIQNYRLQILFHLENCHSIPSFDNGFMEELKESFSTTTKNLVNDDIEVENNMAYVSKYRTDGKYDFLSGAEVIEISSKILPLFPPIPGEPKTKSFDLFMYSMEEDFLSRKRRGADTKEIDKKDKEHISKLVNELLKLKNVPQVMAKAALLKDFYDDEDLFENGSLQKLEGYRRELRDLMSFLPDRKDFLITSFEDKVLDQDGEHSSLGKKEPSYMEKVSRYLEDATKPTLAKIRNLDELTKAEQEELRKLFTVTYGTDADFKNLSGGMELLPYIRKQIGIAEEAIEAKLGSILHSPKLNEIQLSILEQILDYCKINGDIDFKKLGNVSPFSNIDFTNVFKANILDLKKFVTMLHKPVEWKN